MGMQRFSSFGRLMLAAGAFGALVLVAGACSPPEPPPPPDPLIECTSLSGGVTYTPGAVTGVDDVTATVNPGSAVSGCTDHTGSAITSASISGTLAVTGACVTHAPGTAYLTGSGQITWSDSSTSTWSGQIYTEGGPDYSWALTLTAGRWAGATARVPFHLTAVSGNCSVATPLTGFTVAGGPLVLHPAGTPARPPLTGVARVSAGGYHACARLDGGTVRCWGDNTYGQLGNGTSGPSPSTDALVPTPVSGLSGVEYVAAGEYHTCALRTDGTVACWGSNDQGQLGNGGSGSTTPVAVAGVSGATAISAGTKQTCVIVGGGVTCWGRGTSTPTAVAGTTPASSVSVGGTHACAVVGTGVRCWGGNAHGQLGDGTNLDSATPVDVTGITSGATAVVAGPYDSSCAVVAGGAVKCWGWNNYGQLGDGTTTDSNVPVSVGGVSGATGVGLGAVHGCARLVDATATCWGNNNYGQLGSGASLPANPAAVVGGLSATDDVSVGHYFNCAHRVSGGGTVACWGDNAEGQLGNGSRAGSSSPVTVVRSN